MIEKLTVYIASNCSSAKLKTLLYLYNDGRETKRYIYNADLHTWEKLTNYYN